MDGLPAVGPSNAELATTANAIAASHRAVFDALDEAFCVIEVIFDDAGRAVDYLFVESNGAFEDHTGLSDVRGKTVRSVVPEVEPVWIETYGKVATSREPIRVVEESRPLRRWFSVYAWPLEPASGRLVAVHFTDITARKASEEALLHRSKEFHTLVHQAPIGVTLLDGDLRIVEANPAALTMFRGPPDLVGRGYQEFLRSVWPTDRADEVVAFARGVLETGVPRFEPEMEVVHVQRGATEYYDWSIDRVVLPDGFNGLVCYFSDVTKHVRIRQELTAAENHYRLVFESIDEGFAIVELIVDDQDQHVDYRFVEVNAAFERQAVFEDAVGRTITELMPDDAAGWVRMIGAVARTGQGARIETHIGALDRWFAVYAFRVGDPGDAKVATLFGDITDRKRAEFALQESVALLRHHAHHDALTGLPNRLRFEQKLAETVANADRHGRPFAVLFLDLDGFKQVNDDLGHAAGDAVLIEVGRRLRRSLRATDMLARIHGDEFVFILPEMGDAASAGGLAEKILAIVGAPIETSGTTVRVHASIGVGLYPNDGANPRAVLRAADDAMYRAKLGGKNAVSYVVAPSEG